VKGGPLARSLTRGAAPMCTHQPPCPSADSSDREAARSTVSFCEQGWTLLCNGVILFEDTGEILPDGTAIEPHRPAVHALAAV
jgi:Family of unknown function (DUF5999)